MQEKLEVIRCGGCQRKLGEGRYSRLEIKCPRCGTHNVLRASAADHSVQSPIPARPERHQSKGLEDDDQNGGAKAL